MLADLIVRDLSVVTGIILATDAASVRTLLLDLVHHLHLHLLHVAHRGTV